MGAQPRLFTPKSPKDGLLATIELDRGVLMIPKRLVAKRGAILSFENLPRVRCTISIGESLVLSMESAGPPMAFKISSDSQVLRLFL